LFLDGGNKKAAGTESKTMPTLIGRLKPVALTAIEDSELASSGGKAKRLTLVFVSNKATPKRTAVLFLRHGYRAFAVTSITITPLKSVYAYTEIL
jgi:hypothetical protein